jgi:N-acetylneuraminic acid mutarotase
VHQWERIHYKNTPPSKRTGHAIVSHLGKLYLFGGTDGSYHYNDTWSYDLATGEWVEISCIGYIPHPREGHAAAIVDDVMYVFGGRDVNGKDLGDLAAFRITSEYRSIDAIPPH